MAQVGTIEVVFRMEATLAGIYSAGAQRMEGIVAATGQNQDWRQSFIVLNYRLLNALGFSFIESCCNNIIIYLSLNILRACYQKDLRLMYLHL